MGKLYPCEMEGCDRQVPLRSRVKSGEHTGKKICPSCYAKYSGSIKTTAKAITKRKEERKDLPIYFEYHISRIKRCENCGNYIPNPGVKNVAHILPKSIFKSVNSHLDNVLYLCTIFDGDNACHETFDKSWESAKSMPVWDLAISRYLKFRQFVTEKSFILNHFKNDQDN